MGEKKTLGRDTEVEHFSVNQYNHSAEASTVLKRVADIFLVALFYLLASPILVMC